jgi:hypothetical protein
MQRAALVVVCQKEGPKWGYQSHGVNMYTSRIPRGFAKSRFEKM